MIKLKSLLKEIKKGNPSMGERFQVGESYSDYDVLMYIMSQHEDFEDDYRVSGTFKCLEMNPKDIEESEYNIEDSDVELLIRSGQPYPPIVLNKFGWIIDGGHRLEAAKLRGDEKIKVLKQL